ncbi:MAG: DUF6263 family protein [Planctomycetaceae bacterium]|nr:DUF6263 family protein [Planctomycetaceae bacterium]
MTSVRLLAGLLMTALAGSAMAAEKLELKQQPKSKSVYQTETKTEQVLTIADNNIETKATAFIVTAFTAGERAADGSLTITEKHDVMQTSLQLPGVEFQFDSANPDKEPSIPQLKPIADALRTSFKTPITSVIEKDGKVREVSVPEAALADLDPAFKGLFDPDKLKKAAVQARSMFPDQPVSPGDTWERNADVNLDSAQTLSFIIKFEYTGVVDKDGRKLHRIVSKPLSVTYSMAADSPSPLKITQSDLKITDSEGELLFNQELGITDKDHSRMRIEGPMTFTIGGQELAGKVNLQITKTSTRQP